MHSRKPDESDRCASYEPKGHFSDMRPTRPDGLFMDFSSLSAALFVVFNPGGKANDVSWELVDEVVMLQEGQIQDGWNVPDMCWIARQFHLMNS